MLVDLFVLLLWVAFYAICGAIACAVAYGLYLAFVILMDIIGTSPGVILWSF